MLDRPEELLHELRSPMSAILAHANALLEGWRGSPEEAERLAAIRFQAQHLLRFLAHPDAAVRRERLPPLQLAEEAVRLFRGAAGQRGLELACTAEGALPEWVELDATTVRLVLANLLGNALKFTNAGWVRIAVSVPAAGRLRHAVADSGIGMDAEQLARLRGDRVQVHASSPARGGQGLGLAAARRFAERAGGSLVLSSLPGQGTCAALDLPLVAAGPDGPPPAPRAPLPEALLVHLDDTARLAIAAALKGAGYSVTATADPADATRRAVLAHAAGRDFRAVFIASACCSDPELLRGLAGGAPASRLVAVGDGPLPAACQARVSPTPTRDELLAAIG